MAGAEGRREAEPGDAELGNIGGTFTLGRLLQFGYGVLDPLERLVQIPAGRQE